MHASSKKIWLTDQAMLQIQCPHCRALTEDHWDAQPSQVQADMRCEHCGENYRFLIAECLRCAHETVRTWKSEQSEAALAALSCPQCGTHYVEYQGEAFPTVHRS